MKSKSTLVALLTTALLSGMPFQASAQKYDFSGVDMNKMIDLFYDALASGKEHPTDEQIMSTWKISKADLAFIKSHVKPRATLDTKTSRLRPETYDGRKLWMNTPMGSGSGGSAGYPTKIFHSDVFSLWNYVSLWGSWNHGIGQVPGAWTDAAHKNGCDMLGGTIFFDPRSTAGHTTWTKVATTKDSHEKASYKGYKYVKALVNMLRYFGMDGLNINWEVGSPEYYKGFHQALYSYAHETGFKNFHMGMYTLDSSLTGGLSGNATTSYADQKGQISDLMLNYNGEYRAGSSVRAAKTANSQLGASGLWQGFWIVNMNHSWTALNEDNDAREMNICLWGEHKDSRFWSYNSGSSTFDAQNNYQTFLERAFSGGNRNPLSRPRLNDIGNNMEWNGDTPPLSTFAGFSEWIPERSTVQGKLPFATNFCLGNGDRYNYRGIKVSGGWYNMSAQDVVPTYRWLVLKAGEKVSSTAAISTDIIPTFTHSDAFTGGSCIELKANAQSGSISNTDIVLYSTDLTPNDAKTYALVSIKGGGVRTEGPVKSNLALILHVNNAWKEYAIPDNEGLKWQEHRIALDLKAGDKIDKVGFRVLNADKNFDMLIGSLQINDGHTVAPAQINSLEAIKTGETPSTMDVKLNWNVNVAADAYGVAYNSNANIDHFEILIKDGEQGKVREIGRTTQWATFVGNIDVKDLANPYIGVVAVSTDMKTIGEPLWEHVVKDPNAQEQADADPYGTYGESTADRNAEGFLTACKCRAVESFKTKGATKDINYVTTYEQFQKDQIANDSALYKKVSDQVLEVSQGETFDFWLKGFDGSNPSIGSSDDLTWCFVGGWMDFDGSGTFNYGKGMQKQLFWKDRHSDLTDYYGHPITTNFDGEEQWALDESSNDGVDPMGERVFRAGTLRGGNRCFVKADGYHGKITIPADAHLGKSRLRIVWSDAWFQGAFGPTGKTNKGYTLDIDVVIKGNNVDGQRQPVELHDKGDAADWNVVTDIDEVSLNAATQASVRVVAGNLVFTNTSTATIYTADGRQVKQIKHPSTVAGKSLGNGVFLVRLNGGKTVKVVL